MKRLNRKQPRLRLEPEAYQRLVRKYWHATAGAAKIAGDPTIFKPITFAREAD